MERFACNANERLTASSASLVESHSYGDAIGVPPVLARSFTGKLVCAKPKGREFLFDALLFHPKRDFRSSACGFSLKKKFSEELFSLDFQIKISNLISPIA